MNDRYSHRERLEGIMEGEPPDRAAASIWRHFYHRETTAESLAEAMLAFQKRFDWDFMKINPRASYHVEDWGNRLEWSGDEFSKHEKIRFAVDVINDWDKIEPLQPTAPVLAEHLRAVSLIRKSSDPELPLMMTVFCPIGIARYLCGGKEKLLEHLRQAPAKVASALENITVTFEKYIPELRQAGADGIFYATLEWASEDSLSWSEYEKYGRPYDLRLLKASGEDSLDILHVCSHNNYVREMADYPVALVNWDASDPTNVSVEDSFGFLGDKTVIGTLDDRGWLHHSKPVEIISEVDRIKHRMAGRRFIFGPGCAVAPEIPYENFDAVRNSL